MQPGKLTTPLDHEPEIQQQVARIVAYYQILEGELGTLLGALLRIEGRWARRILLEMSHKRRREFTLEVLEDVMLETPLKQNLKKLISKDAKAMTKLRNSYAHHIYGAGDKPGQLRLINPINHENRVITMNGMKGDADKFAVMLTRFQELLLDLHRNEDRALKPKRH